MSSVVRNYAAHTHLRSTLHQALGNNRISSGGALQGTGDGQDTVMYTGDDLADASLDASFVAQVSHIFTGLADDDTRFLGRDNGTKSQHGLSVLFFGLGSDLDVTRVDHVVDIGHGFVNDGGSVVNLGGVHGVKFGIKEYPF